MTVYKYKDLNGSGSKDPSEPFLSGWTIKIYQGSSTTPLATQTTNGSGQATFSVKPDQAYRICETLQSGWFNTDPGDVPQGTDPCKMTTTLGADQAAILYFGNRKALTTGARTKGFWRNNNGQGVITASCSPSGKPSLYSFLTQYNPFKDLTSSSCSAIAGYVTNIVDAADSSGTSMNPMLKAQMLSTALDVYFSDPALGWSSSVNSFIPNTTIGGITIDLQHVCAMFDSSADPAVCTGSFRDAGECAFGGADSMTVSQMLAYAASKAAVATSANPLASPWYEQVKTTQECAKDAFDAINNEVAFGP